MRKPLNPKLFPDYTQKKIVDGTLDDFGGELAVMENNQPRLQTFRNVQKLFEIRIAPRVPIDLRHPVQTSGERVEGNESVVLQVA